MTAPALSGWIFLVIGLFVSATDLLVGRFLATRGPDSRVLYNDNRRLPPEIANRVGRLVMMFSPVFLLIFAALAFGLIPVDAIEPISFN